MAEVKIVGINDENGVKINLATEEKQNPVGKYRITDIDSNGYYGFLNENGNWYIMLDDAGAFRYAKGDTNYLTAWEGRAALEYGYFSDTF